MPINRRIAFRFGKEFTNEQFKEMHLMFKFHDESDTLRKLLAAGYSQYRYAGENITKVKKMMDALGVSERDLEVIKKEVD